MPRIKELFFKPKQEPLLSVKAFNFPAREVISYGKEDRSERVTYAGIGQSEYGSGYPPVIYDDPISAVEGFPLVYSVITAISAAVASLGVKVYEVKGGQRIEVEDHPFYQLYARPNPYQGSFEFMEAFQETLDVCGNVFLAKEKAKGTVELYSLNPKYTAILPDPKIRVKAYRYYINGQSVDYKPEEVIHIKYNNLSDPYFGLPPLATAADVFTFEKNRLQFATQYFVNGAIPAGVLETEQVLGDTLLRKLRNEWTLLHQGVKNSHKVAIAQGGLKYRPIASPIKDLDFTGLKKLSKEDILAIFKVPESILGSQDGTGSNEGRDAITAFWRQCIIPRLKRIESGLNRGLSKEIFSDGKYVFEFNLKEVAALQDDKNELADYLNTLVASSILTPNEARSIIGQPRREGEEYADKLLVSNAFFGNQLMPVEAAARLGAGSTAEKPSTKPKPAKPDKEAKPKPTK